MSNKSNVGNIRRYVGGLSVALFAMLATLSTYTPSQAQTAPAPKAYVGLFKDNGVAVIDTGTNKVLGTIPVPAGPDSMLITPDGKMVYVSSTGDSKISIIDTATDKVTGTIEVGKGPYGLAVTPDGKHLLAGVVDTGVVDFIDLPGNTIVAQLPVDTPHNIGLSPDGLTAYVASQSKTSPSLLVLSVADHKQTASVALTAMPRSVVFSKDGKQVYFTEVGVDSVQVLDPTTNKIITQITVGASPHQPFFADKYALIVSQKTNELNIIDPATNTLKATIPVGKMPHWIATSADGNTAYVSNENDNSVSVVDLGTEKVTATIAVGQAPHKIVLQPAAMAGYPSATMAATMAATATN